MNVEELVYVLLKKDIYTPKRETRLWNIGGIVHGPNLN